MDIERRGEESRADILHSLLLQPTSLMFAGGAHPVGSSMYSMLASYMHERTDTRALEGNDIVI